MQINVQHVFKMSPPERTHALSRTRHWSMDAPMRRLVQCCSKRSADAVAVRQHFESLSGRRAAVL